MFYIIVQIKNNTVMPLGIKFFKTFDEADIERIYLQPDYENLLKVISI